MTELEVAVEIEEGSYIHGAKCRRNLKKCGICGIVGHTRKKCQDLGRFIKFVRFMLVS